MVAATKTNPKKSTNRSRKASAMGTIQRDTVYPQHVFCKLLGITRFAVRDMRKRGLRVKKDGRYSVIRGADYLDYVDRLPTVDQKLHSQSTPQGSDQSPSAVG